MTLILPHRKKFAKEERKQLEQIFDVQRIGPGQYHWPSLDADVELEALEHPEHYPLIWRDQRK